MLNIVASHPLPFILAVIIGIATAWWIWGRLGSIVSDAANSVSETVSDAADSVADTAGKAKVAVVDTASDAGSAVTGAVAGGAAAVGAGAAAIAGGVKDTASGAVDAVKDIAKPKIAAAVGDPDDLTKINGIGPKLCELCNSLGVSRFDQIAAWSSADVAEVDGHLGSFRGRIDRDNWIEQAKLLAAGNMEEWEARFGYKAKPS
ncbi:MAG: hypothetical protein H6918_05875 [Sphingomonadaceae bacterium]|nr:hypothetical protein [Sphingomonadaceae bacterium]